MALQHRLLKIIQKDVKLDLPYDFGEHFLQWLDADQIVGLSSFEKKFDNLEDRLDNYLVIHDEWFNTSDIPEKGGTNEN